MILNFQGPGDEEVINKASTTDLESYRRLFDGVRSEKAIGEIYLAGGNSGEISRASNKRINVILGYFTLLRLEGDGAIRHGCKF